MPLCVVAVVDGDGVSDIFRSVEDRSIDLRSNLIRGVWETGDELHDVGISSGLSVGLSLRRAKQSRAAHAVVGIGEEKKKNIVINHRLLGYLGACLLNWRLLLHVSE